MTIAELSLVKVQLISIDAAGKAMPDMIQTIGGVFIAVITVGTLHACWVIRGLFMGCSLQAGTDY